MRRGGPFHGGGRPGPAVCVFAREPGGEAGGREAILTAHHADDNAETMLLNLIRGTGVAGLAGMDTRGHLPPFLVLSRQELAQYAAAT